MDPPGSPKRRRTVSTSKTPSRHPRPQPNKNAPNLNNDGKRSREVQEFADNIQPAAKRFLFGSTTSVNPADSERPDTATVHADESTGFQSGTHEHLFTVRLGKGKTTPIVRKHYHQDMMSHPYFSQNPDAKLTRNEYLFYYDIQQFFDGQELPPSRLRTLQTLLTAPSLTNTQLKELGKELGYKRKDSTRPLLESRQRTLRLERALRDRLFRQHLRTYHSNHQPSRLLRLPIIGSSVEKLVRPQQRTPAAKGSRGIIVAHARALIVVRFQSDTDTNKYHDEHLSPEHCRVGVHGEQYIVRLPALASHGGDVEDTTPELSRDAPPVNDARLLACLSPDVRFFMDSLPSSISLDLRAVSLPSHVQDQYQQDVASRAAANRLPADLQSLFSRTINHRQLTTRRDCSMHAGILQLHAMEEMDDLAHLPDSRLRSLSGLLGVNQHADRNKWELALRQRYRAVHQPLSTLYDQLVLQVARQDHADACSGSNHLTHAKMPDRTVDDLFEEYANQLMGLDAAQLDDRYHVNEHEISTYEDYKTIVQQRWEDARVAVEHLLSEDLFVYCHVTCEGQLSRSAHMTLRNKVLRHFRRMHHFSEQHVTTEQEEEAIAEGFENMFEFAKDTVQLDMLDLSCTGTIEEAVKAVERHYDRRGVEPKNMEEAMNEMEKYTPDYETIAEVCESIRTSILPTEIHYVCAMCGECDYAHSHLHPVRDLRTLGCERVIYESTIEQLPLPGGGVSRKLSLSRFSILTKKETTAATTIPTTMIRGMKVVYRDGGAQFTTEILAVYPNLVGDDDLPRVLIHMPAMGDRPEGNMQTTQSCLTAIRSHHEEQLLYQENNGVTLRAASLGFRLETEGPLATSPHFELTSSDGFPSRDVNAASLCTRCHKIIDKRTQADTKSFTQNRSALLTSANLQAAIADGLAENPDLLATMLRTTLCHHTTFVMPGIKGRNINDFSVRDVCTSMTLSCDSLAAEFRDHTIANLCDQLLGFEDSENLNTLIAVCISLMDMILSATTITNQSLSELPYTYFGIPSNSQPAYTIAYHDLGYDYIKVLGRLHPDITIPPVTYFEDLLLSPLATMGMVIKMNAFGTDVPNLALRGHFITYEIDAIERVLTNSYPCARSSTHVNVVFIGNESQYLATKRSRSFAGFSGYNYENLKYHARVVLHRLGRHDPVTRRSFTGPDDPEWNDLLSRQEIRASHTHIFGLDEQHGGVVMDSNPFSQAVEQALTSDVSGTTLEVNASDAESVWHVSADDDDANAHFSIVHMQKPTSEEDSQYSMFEFLKQSIPDVNTATSSTEYIESNSIVSPPSSTSLSDDAGNANLLYPSLPAGCVLMEEEECISLAPECAVGINGVHRGRSFSRVLRLSWVRLFPNGLPPYAVGNSDHANVKFSRYLLFQHDRRWAQTPMLVSWMYNQQYLFDVNCNTKCHLKSNTGNAAAFREEIQREDFINRVYAAERDPTGPIARDLMRLADRFVMQTRGKISWTDSKRSSDLDKILAMAHFHGFMNLFITFALAPHDSVISLRLTGLKVREQDSPEGGVWELELPITRARSQLMANDPVIAARIFERMTDLFIRTIMGVRESSTTKVSHEASGRGLFGPCTGLIAVPENNQRSFPHLHAGTWCRILDPRVLNRYVHNPVFRDQLIRTLDALVQCTNPTDIQKRLHPEGVHCYFDQPRWGAIDLREISSDGTIVLKTTLLQSVYQDLMNSQEGGRFTGFSDDLGMQLQFEPHTDEQRCPLCVLQLSQRSNTEVLDPSPACPLCSVVSPFGHDAEDPCSIQFRDNCRAYVHGVASYSDFEEWFQRHLYLVTEAVYLRRRGLCVATSTATHKCKAGCYKKGNNNTCRHRFPKVSVVRSCIREIVAFEDDGMDDDTPRKVTPILRGGDGAISDPPAALSNGNKTPHLIHGHGEIYYPTDLQEHRVLVLDHQRGPEDLQQVECNPYLSACFGGNTAVSYCILFLPSLFVGFETICCDDLHTLYLSFSLLCS